MKVINNNVVLKKVKNETTISGIIMNNTIENIGEVCFYDEALTNIKEGNIVAYNPNKVFNLKYKSNEYMICNINDILCILE